MLTPFKINLFRPLKIAAVIFCLAPGFLGAEENLPKAKRLEEMSAEEFKEALRKSHAEIESRLGGSGSSSETGGNEAPASSSSEKRAYETSAESRIDRLSSKITALENHYTDNWGYAQKDAAKLRDIQTRARQELNKIRSDNTDSWKSNRQSLEGILRQASDY